MDYRTTVDGKTVGFTLTGRLTYTDHTLFRNLIAEIKSSTANRVMIDLSGVDFIDSSGLGMLLMARDTAQERDAPVALVGAQGQVDRLLRKSRFETLFELA